MIPNKHRHPERRKVCLAVAAFLLLPAMIFSLTGCAVDEMHIVSYTSGAEVAPAQVQSPAVVGGALGAMPWDIILSGVSDILTGARKKAIEQKVGYKESRSFSIFRIKTAEDRGDSPGKSVKPPEQPPEQVTK